MEAVGFGWTRYSPVSSETLVRSCQIHPRSGEILSDPVRFLPNLDEKSLVWPDLVFIVPEIDGFKWKSGRNLEKMAKFYGLQVDRVSQGLKEEIRNRPANVRFLESGLESERQSSQIRWFRAGRASWMGGGLI